MEVKLRIIPKPHEGSRTVIEPMVTPAFEGKGEVDYKCGGCGATLAEKITQGQIRNIVVHCPNCKQYNEFP